MDNNIDKRHDTQFAMSPEVHQHVVGDGLVTRAKPELNKICDSLTKQEVEQLKTALAIMDEVMKPLLKTFTDLPPEWKQSIIESNAKSIGPAFDILRNADRKK